MSSTVADMPKLSYRLQETQLADAYVIELAPFEDARGFFAVSWESSEFARLTGRELNWVQTNLSQNHERGTLRGMHAQAPPHAEYKLVRCIRGAIFDVIVDMRPDSQTFGRWFGVELSAANRRSLLVPPGFAHGYQTLEDDAEVLYQVTEYYHPESDCSIRYDDPAIGIDWPLPVTAVSEKDCNQPALVDRVRP